MPNTSRNDPSSLSFGRRLSNNERIADVNRREIEDLKRSLPNAKSLQGAALAADVIKQQRQAAKHTLADSTSSLEQLNAIDPSILTPAYREQLRLNKHDAAMRELAPEAPTFAFDEQAMQRFNNWKQQAVLNPQSQQAFAATNFTPEQLTPFQRWDQRQKSLAGRQWNAQAHKAEYDREVLRARRQSELKRQSKPQGKHIGGLKDLNK